MSPLESLQKGQVLGPLEVDVDRAVVAAYADASGDRNPIHLDDAAARALGLPGVLAHGMWTMGAALRLVDVAVPGARIRHTKARFGRPLVLPEHGSTQLRVVGEVVDVDGATATLAITAHAFVGEVDERIARLEVTID